MYRGFGDVAKVRKVLRFAKSGWSVHSL